MYAKNKGNIQPERVMPTRFKGCMYAKNKGNIQLRASYLSTLPMYVR